MYIETFGPQAAAPVLFLHGGGAAGWSWRYAVQALGERYRCIVPDLPGSGKSLQDGPFQFERAAQELAGVMAGLGAGRVHLVGLSLGGQLGTLLLARQPTAFASAFLSGVLARDVPGSGCAKHPVGQALLRATLAAYWPFRARDFWVRANMRAYGIPAEFTEEVRTETRNLRIDAFLGMIVDENMSFRLPPGLEQVTAPVLVTVGEKEYEVVHQSARDLAARLPRGRAVRVQGAGHNWPLETPHLFNRALQDWLAGQPLPVELAPLR